MPNDAPERIAKQVSVLFETFGKEGSEERFQGYLEGLEGQDPELVKKARIVAVRRMTFLPSVAELIEVITELREKMPARRESDPDCQLCGGTGWKVVERTAEQGGGRLAVRCDCRNRKVA